MTPLGMTASTTGINTGIALGSNLVNGLIGNFLWNEQAEKAYKLNEKSADNAMKRSIDLYNLLQSPQAIVNQLKEAGLSKSLMYAKGGMGGQTQAGPQANGIGLTGHNMASVQQIDPLTMAQIKNLNADTSKKEADTNLTKSQIETQKWVTKYTEFQSKNEEFNYELNEATFANQYEKSYNEAKLILYRSLNEYYDQALKADTFQLQIQTITQNLACLKMQEKYIESSKDLNDATRRKTLQEIQLIAKKIEEIDSIIGRNTKLNELSDKQIWEIQQKYGWNINKEDLKYLLNFGLEAVNTVRSFLPTEIAETILKDFTSHGSTTTRTVTSGVKP